MQTLFSSSSILFIIMVLLLAACQSDRDSSADKHNQQKLTVTSPSTFSIEENTTSIAKLDVSLIDSTVTFALTGGADQSFFELDAKLGQLRFIQAPDFEAPDDHDTDNVYELVVRVANENESVEHSIGITITDVDETPYFTSLNEFSILENTKDVAIVNAEDPEATPINYRIEADLDGGLFTINASTGVLSFNNAPDFEAPQDHNGNNTYELFITVSDGINQTQLKFLVNVLGVNEFPPSFPQTQWNVSENNFFDQTTGADADGDELTYQITGGADQAHFMIDSSTDALRFKEGPDYESPTDANGDNQYEVTVRVSDGENSDTETLTLTIDPVNEAPVFTSTPTIDVIENNQIDLTVIATDPEGDAVNYELVGGADAALFDFDVNTHELRFKITPDFETPTDSDGNNQYDIIVSASDQSLTSEQQIHITVTGENDNAPVFTSADTFNYFENNSATIAISANDIDGDSLQYSIIDSTPNLDETAFSINSETGVLSFNNSPNYEDPQDNDSDNVYQVEIRVFDGIFSTTKTIAIHIKDDPEQLDVVSGGIKTLRFSWPAIPEASHYRLLQNPDGASGFAAVSENIANGVGTIEFDFEIPVHLTHWATTTFVVEAYDNDERLTESPQVGVESLMLESIGYVKAASPDAEDWFGHTVAISGDGNTIAVGVVLEDSAVRDDPSNNENSASGAVYVYAKTNNIWKQQAYLKALNSDESDQFGMSVSLSNDGNVLAIGAVGEDSAATGVNGDASDNSVLSTGAVYLLERTNNTWQQTNYIKASNPDELDSFGYSISLSGDGLTLAVSALGEKSNATGINGDQENDSLFQSGAVYVFSNISGDWRQQAYIKASNTGDRDRFGQVVALSDNGNTLLITAHWEDSALGDPNDNSLEKAGAAYVFTRLGNTWEQHSFIKSPAPDGDDWFGYCAAINGDGKTIAIGAPGEDSNATGVNGDAANNDVSAAGAVYVYKLIESTWQYSAYIKPNNTGWNDSFGTSLSLSESGAILVISADSEDSASQGIDGEPHNNTIVNSGSAYLFEFVDETWRQAHYTKATNPGNSDFFGGKLDMSDDGKTLVVGASGERSSGQGFTADPNNDDLEDAGAVYIY